MKEILDRLRSRVQALVSVRGHRVSLSVGAVTYLHPAAGMEEMVRRADCLMYRAKKKGKDAIEHEVVE
jgi:GGDEF domain-containing protein